MPVSKELEALIERLDDHRDALATMLEDFDDIRAEAARLGRAAPITQETRDKVSPTLYAKKAPELVELLLAKVASGKTVGLLAQTIADNLEVSARIALRIGRQVKHETGFLRDIPGRGGRGTLFRLEASRIKEARKWVEQNRR